MEAEAEGGDGDGDGSLSQSNFCLSILSVGHLLLGRVQDRDRQLRKLVMERPRVLPTRTDRMSMEAENRKRRNDRCVIVCVCRCYHRKRSDETIDMHGRKKASIYIDIYM